MWIPSAWPQLGFFERKSVQTRTWTSGATKLFGVMPELGHGDDNFGIAGERFSARCLEVTPEATERERESSSGGSKIGNFNSILGV